MTLNDVSTAIASGNDDVALVARRIRHWTNEKLVPAETDVHTGKGRHRTYNISGLIIAAILWELSRYSIPVGILDKILSPIVEFLVVSGIENDPFGNLTSSAPLSNMWYVVHYEPGSDRFMSTMITDGILPTDMMSLPSLIVINLERLAECITKTP